MPEIPKKRKASVGDKALGSPTVRLAMSNDGGQHEVRLQADLERDGGKLRPPNVRLAVSPNTGGANSVEHHVGKGGLGQPDRRLAHVPGAQGDNNLLGQRGVEALPEESRPALLVSYVYLPQFLENRHRYCYRDWVLDSGAFSAHNSGTVIKLQDYIDCCKELIATDPTLTEVFALDVIGNYKASLKNAEAMWKQGVPAIPTFHYGEPWDVLRGIAKDYPKIALGGCVGKRNKDKFAQQCFARVWPKKIHGFGFGSEKSIMLVPFHSVDATNWELAPCKYGTWKAFGHQRVSVRGSRQNLRAEVEWYLDLERRARERWKKEMAKLLELDRPAIQLGYNPGPVNAYNALSPSLRLGTQAQGVDRINEGLALRRAAAGNTNTNGVADSLAVRRQADAASGGGRRLNQALEQGPTVRLAQKESGREDGKGLTGPTVRLVGAADDITDRRPVAFSKRGEEAIRPRKIQRSKQ